MIFSDFKVRGETTKLESKLVIHSTAKFGEVHIDFSGHSEARKNNQSVLTTFPEAFCDIHFDHSGSITI